MTKSNTINNNITRNKVSSKDIIHFLMDILFGFSIFRHYPNEDVIKQEYVAFITIKICQIIALSLIPIGLTISILIRQSTSTETMISNNDYGGLIASYTGSILFIIFGIIIPKIFNWKIIPIFPKEKWLFISRMLRIVFFIIPLIFASLLLIHDNNWITAIPLYLLIGVVLVITFPTKRRWNKWTGWTSLLD